MPLQATSGAASYDGFGGGVAAVPQYIEDVFSCFLYKGNSLTQTITNNIDLSTKGGLVWIKSRDTTFDHMLFDTARGAPKYLNSNTATAESTNIYQLSSFNANGFTLGDGNFTNNSAYNYVSWTFRKQPKFFDVVTWTGNDTARTIAHNLGSVPGCIMVKRTSGTAQDWNVYHQSLGNSFRVLLNSTSQAFDVGNACWNSTTPTSTVFSLGTNSGVNATGATYVAYLFAHDAGGFGLLGTDNVISCGTFTTDGAGAATVNLGYEPQWVMTKDSSGSSAWRMFDTMRGLTVAGQNDALLQANSSAAEIINSDYCSPTATGFEIAGHSGSATHIYIAIRRGPMKVPTLGTSVFSPIASAAAGGTQLTTNFPVDLQMYGILAGDAANITTNDRLRGVSTTSTAGGNFIVTSSTAAETGSSYTRNWGNTGFVMPAGIGDQAGIFWNFQRAPSFFDEVCYTGTGSATTFSHNLTVVPELMIVKSRTVANSWLVYISALGPTKTLTLNAVSKEATSATAWNNTAPTASVFTLGSAAAINTAASTNVAYLFATLAGVSKVGNYTGTGATQTINCGFTGGARFVLIKRTDNPGAWYVWDTARGMVSGTDPSLLLNSTAAEVNANSVYTITTGFQIVTTVDDINTAGGEYIFFAIA
jgi:hypothetical protein